MSTVSNIIINGVTHQLGNGDTLVSGDGISIETLDNGYKRISVTSFDSSSGLNGVFYLTDNTQWISVTLDSDERIIEGIYSDGTKYIAKLDSPTIDDIKTSISGISGNGYAITRVATWGDSITDAGTYQTGIADVLGISSSDVVDYGISSDFTAHIRRRFVSYYTDETVYAGNDGTHYDSSGSLTERQSELENSFILIFMGTNNIGNIKDVRSSGFTLSNSSFESRVKELYPDATDDDWQTYVDMEFDAMYASSYKDAMLSDLQEMVSIIPHNNWAIITGHGLTSSSDSRYEAMAEVDDIITKMYPHNVINLKQLFASNYDYLDIKLAANFIKPETDSAVDITLNDVTTLNTTQNTICIGTRQKYDTYTINSIDTANNSINATLTATGTYWSSGDTIKYEYPLISDLGRDVAFIPVRVYRKSDINTFDAMEFAVSAASLTGTDNVHPSRWYIQMGRIIGKEIAKIVNNNLIKYNL